MNHRTFSRTILASALIASTAAAQAGPAHESLVRARVISSAPIYQTVNEPRTECWTDTVAVESPRHRDGGGAVIGAIAGGLIGSTVGKGNGRIAAAAVGAATGAVIGDRISERSEHRHVEARDVERCRSTDSYRRVVSGYDVRYRYQGQDYSTRLPYDPGRFVKLRVSVAVVDEPDGNYRRTSYDHDDWNREDERRERDERGERGER